MTTVGDAVDRCLNTWLMGTFSAQTNAVKVGITGSTDATEITCTLPLTGIGTGALIAIENELCYVADTDQTNNRLVVVRGNRGTIAAAHIAGTPIEVNPRFPRFMVREMMQADVQAWPDSLYNVQHFSASLGTQDRTITIPTSIDGFVPRHVIKVRRQSLYQLDTRYRRTEGYATEWDLLDNATIMLNDNDCILRTYAVQVACAFDADALDDDDNDLAEDVGLTPGMQEILELGAAYRLLMGRGSVRLFPEAEGQSRAAQEVGSQDIPHLAQLLLALKKDRMGEEAERLTRRNGFGGF